MVSLSNHALSAVSAVKELFRGSKGAMRMRFIVVIAAAAAIGIGSTTVHAQSWRPPADDQRCPSKWGAADQRGAANHMKPDSVLRAARLIRTGEVFELGRVLSGSMPLGGV